MKKDEILKDMVEVLTTFDDICENMYDRGSFCLCDANDAAIDDFIKKMKNKYKVGQ